LTAARCRLAGWRALRWRHMARRAMLRRVRALIRLAYVLNKNLGSEQVDWDTCLKSIQNKQVNARRARRHY